jgi:hypothetical protein
MSKKTLSLDFDGVCHQYTSPWQGADVIPDPPVPGLFNFLMKVYEHFTVEVYSTRNETEAGREAMRKWFWKRMREYEGEVALDMHGCQLLEAAVIAIRFPESKPKAFVGLDDRILTFEGFWPPVQTLLDWKPWNKRLTPQTILSLKVDSDSFDALKELLYQIVYRTGPTDSMQVSTRITCDALKRLHDQIRDLEFPRV